MKTITYRLPRALLDRVPWTTVMHHVWHSPWYVGKTWEVGYVGLRKIFTVWRDTSMAPVEVELDVRTVLSILDTTLTADIPGLGELYPKLVRPLITLYDEEVS